METRLIRSGDGSDTLYVPELNEHYHSTFGAVNESLHIFIEAGLRYASREKSEISVLEIGFGTGLNALLTLIETQRKPLRVHYTSIEAFPLAQGIISQLNYTDIFPGQREDFKKIHHAPWGVQVEITPVFTLYKRLEKIENAIFDDRKYELVFFDAFGPEVQPELWNEVIFSKIFQAMTKGGVLVTYSVKGVVKKALRDSGFMIEKLPGPTGKREITRARKPLPVNK